MTRLTILEHPDPRLRVRSAEVTEFGDDLARLVEGLLETLRAVGGIGLSAPQVGDPRRVSVIDLSGDGSAPEVFVNPDILARKRWAIVEESCLSVPGVEGKLMRATRVRARAVDPTGAPFVRDLEDMHAVCLQHEVDHLDGTLFIDRLSPLHRLRMRWREVRGRRTAASRDGDRITA